MLPRPCYSERVCRFVDDQIAGLRESAGGSRFCLREVCRAAREGVEDFEKFVRGRRGADPRKVKSPHNCTGVGKKAWLFAKVQPGRAKKRINAT